MLDRFHPHKNASDHAADLVKCGQKPDKHVSAYINRFILKLAKVYPPATDPNNQTVLDDQNESAKIEHFINGLTPALKGCLVISKPAKLDNSITSAREYEF